MGFNLTTAQSAVVTNRGGGLLVSAAAGSGKTRVLVERLLDRILTEKRNIDEFLIITFTKAAAEELRGRIFQEIMERLGQEGADRHLRRQPALLYQTQISTIHSFCTVLLREWGQLLDLPPDFSLCEEEEANVLMRQTLQELLETRYEAIQAEDNFAQLLDLLSAGRDDSRLFDIVLDIYGKMQSHHNPEAWMARQLEALALQDVTEAGETVWGQLLLKDSRKLAEYWCRELSRAIALAQEDEQLIAYEESLLATLQAMKDFQEAALSGWDAAAQKAVIPFPRLKQVRGCQDALRQEQIKSIRERCKKTTGRLQERFESSSEALLEDMRLLYPAMSGLFSLVQDFMTAFSAEKRRRNLLDFTDLEHLAVRLLVRENDAPSDLARELRGRYAEILVDEYQDTNQIQNAIFSALSQEGKNLFFVGDVKQSIYRFRLADPTIFLDKYQRFTPYEQAAQGQERKILLSQNFRSRPEVLESVNDVFRAIMSEQLGEMDYTEAEALYPGADFPPGEGYETEFYVLDLSESKEEEEKADKNQLEAQFVAHRIAGLLEEGFPISDGSGGTRAATAEDIAILLRSPGTVRHHYVNALRSLGIPCASDEDGDFFDSVEISVILSYLQIIDNPHQDIPLISVLHSPLCGFDGARLAQVRLTERGDFYSALCAAAEAGDADCRRFLEVLQELRFHAGESSSHKLIWALYERTNALDIFRRLPGGREREGRLLAFYELAGRYERNGHRGLFQFLSHIKKLRESKINLSIQKEAQQTGVTITSIHRSKGLEYPIVVLAGLGKQFNTGDLQKPVLFHQTLGLGPKGIDLEEGVAFQTLPRRAVALQLKREMLAEEMRLLYVAMTRAKEKLILTHALTYGESELIALSQDAGNPVDPQVLERCNNAGKWLILSALARPEATALREVAGVPPLVGGTFGSRWLIQYHHGIGLERKPLAIQPREEPSHPSATLTDEALWENLSWQYPQEALAHIPAKLTATQLVGDRLDAGFTEAQAGVGRALYQRPRFSGLGLTAAQVGSAHHTVLQSISFQCTDTVEAITEELHRLVTEGFLTRQEADSIQIENIWRFFQSPIGKELLSAPTVYREFPFSILLPAREFYPNVPEEEQILLQGVIDCWFETEDGVTVLDFKTNRIQAEAAPEQAACYQKQLETYALALEEITGKQVARRLIWFLHPGMGISC